MLPKSFCSDPDVVARFTRDEAHLAVPGEARGVVRAKTAAEVVELVRWARDEGVPIVARGGGTGLSGAACAVEGCVVLDLSPMDQILEIAPGDRLAVVQPGVLNAALSLAARPHGLMYAPDPSSLESSTIGGNIATNAGGLRCVRYGVTRSNVLGLKVVTGDGQLLATGGRTLKRSAGYDLTQLIIGSEGTLGIVVEATVRLHPLPGPSVTGLLTFPSAPAAAATASALVAEGPPSSLLELIDRASVEAIDAYRKTGFGSDVGAVLLVQCDDAPGAGALVEKIGARHGMSEAALSVDDTEAQMLIDVRRAAYPALQSLGRVLVEDIAVPVSRLSEAVGAVERISQSSGVRIASVAHAGDGNLHPLLIVPPEGDDAAWGAAEEIFQTSVSLGGTVSGEHGIGRMKAGWLAREVGPELLELQRRLKAVFDPRGILNPGAIFASS